ncbi:helix-turn-helix domain-containing protein [Panacagrimonas sp.]|uniref:helix-turn-helix domain-containing protein n=1 Tax=Panacagrimonas sp. TaxID=2480088 RepID=UPI003B51C6D8
MARKEQEASVRRLEAGRRLAELRARLGMTQAELATALGVSHRSIQGYEAGTQEVSSEVLVGLRELFDVNADWILFGPSASPTTGDRTHKASDLARRTYKLWESLLCRAALPIPVEARVLLFDVFVDIAIRTGEVPQIQMEQAAAELIERVAPKE